MASTPSCCASSGRPSRRRAATTGGCGGCGRCGDGREGGRTRALPSPSLIACRRPATAVRSLRLMPGRATARCRTRPRRRSTRTVPLWSIGATTTRCGTCGRRRPISGLPTRRCLPCRTAITSLASPSSWRASQAHQTGEELIRAAEDAAEVGGDLRARREILNDIAPIAKSDPLRLAADEFGLAGTGLAGGGAGAEALEGGESAVESNAGREPGGVTEGKQGDATTPARTTPFVSNDPGVGELANKIEVAYPGSVRGVNMPVYDSDGRLITDADIRIGNVIIQVKSGRGSGLTRQVRRTASTGLRIIDYGPNLGLHVMRGLRREGFEVYDNEADLLKALAAEVGK